MKARATLSVVSLLQLMGAYFRYPTDPKLAVAAVVVSVVFLYVVLRTGDLYE